MRVLGKGFKTWNSCHRKRWASLAQQCALALKQVPLSVCVHTHTQVERIRIMCAKSITTRVCVRACMRVHKKLSVSGLSKCTCCLYNLVRGCNCVPAFCESWLACVCVQISECVCVRACIFWADACLCAINNG